MAGFLECSKIICLLILALELRSVQSFPSFLLPNLNAKLPPPGFYLNSSGFTNIGPATITINMWDDKQAKHEEEELLPIFDNGQEVISKNLLNLFNQDARPGDIVFAVDSNDKPFHHVAEYPISFHPMPINDETRDEFPMPMHVRVIETKTRQGSNPASNLLSPQKILEHLAQKVFPPHGSEYLTISAKHIYDDDKFQGTDILNNPVEFEKPKDKKNTKVNKIHSGNQKKLKVKHPNKKEPKLNVFEPPGNVFPEASFVKNEERPSNSTDPDNEVDRIDNEDNNKNTKKTTTHNAEDKNINLNDINTHIDQKQYAFKMQAKLSDNNTYTKENNSLDDLAATIKNKNDVEVDIKSVNDKKITTPLGPD